MYDQVSCVMFVALAPELRQDSNCHVLRRQYPRYRWYCVSLIVGGPIGQCARSACRFCIQYLPPRQSRALRRARENWDKTKRELEELQPSSTTAARMNVITHADSESQNLEPASE